MRDATLNDAVSKPLLDRGQQIIQQFVKIGKPAIPALIGALNDSEKYGFVRRYAAEAIGKIHSPTSVAPLQRLLRYGNKFQRIGAAESLGRLHSRSSVRRLIYALNHDLQSDVRLEAVHALSRIGERTATVHLIRRVRDRQEEVNIRAYAIVGLAAFPEAAKTVIPLVITVLEEEHQKDPGGFLAIMCVRYLNGVTQAQIDPYETSHITKERQNQAVKSWRRWWESQGRFKYKLKYR